MRIAILTGLQVSGCSDGRLEIKKVCSMRPAVPQTRVAVNNDLILAVRLQCQPPHSCRNVPVEQEFTQRAANTSRDERLSARRVTLTRLVEWLEGQDPSGCDKLDKTLLIKCGGDSKRPRRSETRLSDGTHLCTRISFRGLSRDLATL